MRQVVLNVGAGVTQRISTAHLAAGIDPLTCRRLDAYIMPHGCVATGQTVSPQNGNAERNLLVRLLRNIALIIGALSLAACQTNDLKQPPVPLGDFALGINVALVENVQKSPISREATPEQLKTAMEKAIADRFSRYSGPRLFNIGVAIDGYALSPPGIPILFSPPSVMIVTVSIFEDAKGLKLNPDGERMTIVEKSSPETFIGSGLTQTKARQLDILTYNVAKRIEGYLLDNPDWIGMTAEQAAAAKLQSQNTKKPDEAQTEN